MRPERWQQIVGLFEQAMELPAADRAAFVAGAAGDDAELRAHVLAMLHADARDHALLDATPHALADLVRDDPAIRALEGRRIGPYTLLREIGRGGMGAVWLAERADVDKRVALKLVAGGLASAERVQRFLFERRVLAQLEHPNIARMLDAGVTGDGMPWLALEYVEGQAIDAWCAARALDRRARLDLFVKVCDAVAWAHRNLVVHRDLKPSNILVTAEGEPRLLDFGIAKLLDDSTAEGAGFTRGPQPMTPEYASPEQLRGEAITTATDVYQLGVLLCELLTGERPQAVRSPATDAPPAPPRTLRRQAGEDIDNIVRMALRAEPELRYASALQLGEDIRRHLAGRPVTARPATLRYRASRFVRRNRVAVGAAVAVFVILVGTAIATTLLAGRAADAARVAAAERDRATTEAAKASQVSSFLIDLFQAADPEQALGREITARQLLDRGAQRLGDEGELADQPIVRAELLDVLGRVYRNLNLNAEARPLLEGALALRRQHLDVGDPAVAASLTSVGVLLANEGREAEARPLLEEALAIRTSAATPDSDAIATSLHNLAALHVASAGFDTAETLLRAAIAIRRAHGEPAVESLTETLDGLGIVLSRVGRHAAADSVHGEALALRRARLDPRHPLLANSLNNVGLVKLRRGEAEAAEVHLREAVEIRRAVLGRHLLLAGSLNNLGSSLEAQGRLAEAEAVYRESLAMKRDLIAGDHATIASSLGNLGMLMLQLGRLGEARPLLEETLAMRIRVQGERHPDVALAHHNLAAFHRRTGDLAQAERGYARALEIRRERLGDTHAWTLESAVALAEVLERGRRRSAADSLASWVLEVGAASLQPGDSLLVRALRLSSAARR